MTTYSPKERALRKLLKAAEAITKGFDRGDVAVHAQQYPGSTIWGGISHAKLRDLIDATAAARKAIEDVP